MYPELQNLLLPVGISADLENEVVNDHRLL